jgi:hypothetical protein
MQQQQPPHNLQSTPLPPGVFSEDRSEYTGRDEVTAFHGAPTHRSVVHKVPLQHRDRRHAHEDSAALEVLTQVCQMCGKLGVLQAVSDAAG